MYMQITNNLIEFEKYFLCCSTANHIIYNFDWEFLSHHLSFQITFLHHVFRKVEQRESIFLNYYYNFTLLLLFKQLLVFLLEFKHQYTQICI